MRYIVARTHADTTSCAYLEIRTYACAYTRSENVNLLNVELCNIEIYCIYKAYMLLISERKPKMVNVLMLGLYSIYMYQKTLCNATSKGLK